ncbi:MAG: aminotransferase class I/II-fold pyridoxal phosphate-dependent enzyme [Oscillospiraceae bacterium]|nr:aminotransferase class I/II-fold pyridoxal phosphate-dependent enzyme [Oscillospiraceae bacterium]
MRYDFTTLPDRRGKDAIAVDMVGQPGGFAPAGPKEGFSLIPMWVADMNFLACPAIQEAVIRRTEHPAFGYFEPSEAYYRSIIDWQRLRNGVSGLEKKHIGYENGVLGGVISTLNVLCSRGDPVLVQSPTYVGFTHVLENNGYEIVHNPMYRDEQGVWRLDYEDMERKIVDRHIHATIFCSPHNPCGRVWERWELERALEIFEKHGVWVVSDEIWSDLTLADHRHIPTQSVSPWAREHTAAMYAPSKTFNLAGLVGSYHVIYNDWLRDRQAKESSLCHYNSMNVLSMHALIGAYGEAGQLWVDELRQVLTENVDFAYDFIRERFAGVSLMKPQGTYMLFLHCEAWCRSHGRTPEELQKLGTDVGVAWQDGGMFLDPWGIRMNLALPKAVVREAFERLDRYVFNA